MPGAGAFRSCSAASSGRSECGCGARSTRRPPTNAPRRRRRLPQHPRADGSSLPALAVAIFGGSAPFIAVYLIDRFGSPLAPTFYLMAAAVVSTIVIAMMRETAHEPLG